MAQWIGHQPPELGVTVRFCPGAYDWDRSELKGVWGKRDVPHAWEF